MTYSLLQAMTRRFALLVALLTCFTAASYGQFMFGPHIGLDVSDSDFYVGADAVFQTSWELWDQMLRANPEVDFYFLEDAPGFTQSFTLIALNLLYPLELKFADTYVGAGAILGLYNADFDTSVVSNEARSDFGDTDVGLLGKFGINFGDVEEARIIYWVEGGVHIIDGGGLWVQGGARLVL